MDPVCVDQGREDWERTQPILQTEDGVHCLVQARSHTARSSHEAAGVFGSDEEREPTLFRRGHDQQWEIPTEQNRDEVRHPGTPTRR